MENLIEEFNTQGISDTFSNTSTNADIVPSAASSNVKTTNPSSRNPLCPTCKEINIKEFLFGERKPLPAHLGELVDIVRKTDCALCSLVSQALERSWTSLPLQFNRGLFLGWDNTKIFLTAGEATTSEDSLRTIEINVMHETSTGVRRCAGRCVAPGFSRDGRGFENFQAELRFLGEDVVTSKCRSKGAGRRIKNACDSNLMATWYRLCKDNHHLQGCGEARIISDAAFDTPVGGKIPEASLPPATRFIDVEGMCLVLMSEKCEFVALSYVWGKIVDDSLQTKRLNYKARHERNGLSLVNFPKTIADAISVARDLKIRYLWIDSLCIIQDDDKKLDQIQNMDRIYGLASLVLVSAAGTDATSGLVGYRDSPRAEVDQILGSVDGLQLIVSTPPLKYILGHSKWNTRGWTFQEWHLASRALVFTEQQVYFICSSSSFCEDIALEEVQPHSLMNLILENCNASTPRHYLPGRYSRLQVNSGWIEYLRTVEDYSSRELTHETDTLFAISGLLNNLHRASRNRFLCGVSIGLFHEALFWIPVSGTDMKWTAESLPRPLFPTWSWASWQGPVKYSVFPYSKQCLVAEWQVWTRPSPEGEHHLGILGTPLFEPQNDRFYKGSTFFSDRPTDDDTEGENIRRGLGNLQPNYLDSCMLKFRAEVAILQTAFGIINDCSCRADALLDDRGVYMGVLLMNKQKSTSERATAGFRNVTCIALSVSEIKLTYMDEPAFTKLPDDTQWINLMVVVELPGELFLRIGVGQVSRIAWDDLAYAKSRDINLI